MARVVSGVLLAAVFFALVWYADAAVLLFVAFAVGVLALHEYLELMRQLGAATPRLPTVLALLGVMAMVPFPHVPVAVALGLSVVLIAVSAMTARPRLTPTGTTTLANAASGVAAGGFALIYIAVPLGALVAVHVIGGRGAVLLLVATIAISDTAQYYAGRAFGRHPLSPRLSPKKTIEGAIGGFLVAPVFLYFAGPYLVPPAPPQQVALLGPVLVACGIAGDLFESMIKRAADIKDSSALIPGHGGVLDRIDALLFATPPYYLFLRWIYTA